MLVPGETFQPSVIFSVGLEEHRVYNISDTEKGGEVLLKGKAQYS
jgi:hypothetical protein